MAFKFKPNWTYLAMVLGALINITVQLSSFVEKGELFRQYDNSFSEFIRQFSYLMLLMTVGFFGLIGYLYQRRVDEREEAAEIAETLKARHRRPA